MFIKFKIKVMKSLVKVFAFIFSVLFLSNCSIKNDMDDRVEYSYSHEIKVEEAISDMYLALNSIGKYTKDNASKNIGEIMVITYEDIWGGKTKADNSSDFDKLLYVVNFEGHNGCAVLGADDRIESVIAILDTGHLSRSDFNAALFFEDGLPVDQLYDDATGEIYLGADCPNGTYVSSILNYVEKEIKIYRENESDDPFITSGTVVGNDDLPSYDVSPILNTIWGQMEPYNDKFDKKPAGCTTIAAAQILTSNKNVSLSAHFGVTRSTWNQIDRRHYNGILDDDDVEAYIDSINIWKDDMSTVVKKIADGIGVKYNFLNSGGTFATPKKVKEYLQSLGYSNARLYTSYKESAIIDMLNRGKPVFIGALGASVNSKKGSGHAWVIDGIKTISLSKGTQHFMHCNWGWSGDCNGYYLSKVFDTSNGAVSYDDDDSGEHYMSERYTWWYRVVVY